MANKYIEAYRSKFNGTRGSGWNARPPEDNKWLSSHRKTLEDTGFSAYDKQRLEFEKRNKLIDKINSLSKLKTQDQYNTLREAQEKGIIDKPTRLKLIDAIGQAEQQKIQKEGQPKNVGEHLQSFFGGIGGMVADLASDPNAAIAASNERFLGGTTKGVVNFANLLGSGLNQKEAERRTNEFLRTTGQTNRQGAAPLAQGFDRESRAFKAGQTMGDIQATGLELGASLLPGVAASKAIRAIPAVAKIAKAGGITARVLPTILSEVPGDLLSTAIMSAQDYSKGKKVDLAKNIATSLAFNTALPVAGELLRGAGKLVKKGIDSAPKVVYSAGRDGATAWSTTDKAFSKQFADEAGSTIVKKTIKPSDYLDVRIPAQRTQLEDVLGKTRVNRAISATDNGLPTDIAGVLSQDELRAASKELGYKGITLSETDKLTKFKGKDVISYAEADGAITKPASQVTKTNVNDLTISSKDPVYGHNGKAWNDYNARYDKGVDLSNARTPEEFNGLGNGDPKYFSQSRDGLMISDVINKAKKVASPDNPAYNDMYLKIAKESGLKSKVVDGQVYVGKNMADINKVISGDLTPQEYHNLIGYKPERFTPQVTKTAKGQKVTSGAVPKQSFVEKALSATGKQIKKTKVGQEVIAVKDIISKKLVSNLHTISKPFVGKMDDASGRTVVERIRELATNVRQATGMAADNRANNKAWQELGSHIQSTGGKKAMKDYSQFIKLKQDAINSARASGKKVAIPKGTAAQERAYQLLNQSTKDEVQRAFDAGLIDKVKYKTFMKDENYTRVQRNLEDVLNFKGQGSAEASISSTVLGQKLKGSTKEAVDPFASYIDWSNKVSTQIERNKMATYITDQLLDEKLGRIAKTGETNTLARFRNGMKELIATEPEIVDSIKNMDKVSFGGLQRYVTLPSRTLQAGATGFNVAFSVPNFIRDEVNSFILSKNPLATHNPLAIWQGIKEAIVKPTVNAAARGLKIAKKGQSVWEPSDAFKKYIASNSQMTTVDLVRNLKSATRQAAEEMGLKGESWIRKLESINSASEKLGRFQNFYGTYKKMLKQNLPDSEALSRGMQAARENGIDFSQRGEYSTFMRLFNPYFNASIQGSRSLARALKERPIATSAKIATTILIPIAGSTYYNLSDPKRAAIYANIPDYEREGNLVFVMENGQYMKLPLPPGVKEFGQPLRKIIESEYLGDKPGLLDTAKSLFIDAFNPMGPSDMVPQAAKPVVENLANYSFFKQAPIVGENLTDLAPEDQVYKSTPQAYRDLGKQFNMSPLKVQNLIKGYGAGGAEQIVSVVDAARTSKTLEEAINKAVTDKRGTTGQIKGRFIGEVKKGSGEVTTKFYDAYQPLKARRNSASKKVTEAMKAGDKNKAIKLIDAYNKTVDEQDRRFKTTYGVYEKDSQLLTILNKLKISKKDSALKQRLKD